MTSAATTASAIGSAIPASTSLYCTVLRISESQDKPVQASNSLKFFEWAFNTGDKMAEDLEYVALPAPVKALVRKQWLDVKDGSGKAVAYK